MREIHEVRQALEPHPWNGMLLFPIPRQFLEFLRPAGNIPMTGHTQLHRGNPGDGRLSSMPVTVETIDPERPRVQLMTEGDGLPVLGREIRTAE